MTRQRWMLVATFAFVSVIVGACSIPVRVRREKDGWLLEYTYSRFRCPVCTAVVQRFEFDGHAIPAMRIRKDRIINAAWIDCPVGALTCDGQAYRPGHEPRPLQGESDTLVTPDELAQGWYDVRCPDTQWSYECFARKKGTPAFWCLAHANEDRWIDPSKLGEFEW